MYEFRMPSLGADMEAGTLVEWLKHPGEPVQRGDIVAVVETDKGAIEVEIFVKGVMGKQLVEIGIKVPVGTPLALIEGVAEEIVPAVSQPQRKAPPPSQPAPTLISAAKPGAQAAVRASPAARKLAEARGLALSTVRGSGPDGVIVLRDVEQAVAAAPVHRGLDLGKMRQAIAAAMARSKREIPHYYLATEIDMSAPLEWLAAKNADLPPDKRILPAVLSLKAVALAARKYAVFNGLYESGKTFVPSPQVHLGVAIAIRGGGLAAPAIHDCDRLSLDELMMKLRDLAARARDGHLRSSEMSDATLTVSSLGDRGVESLYGIIYPPQVALVGLGRSMSKPVAVGEKVEARNMMSATLAGDHRVSDGHLGSRFLAEIAARLQEPDKL